MCNYCKANICTITNAQCPYMYFCNRVRDWVPMRSMSKSCKVKESAEAPKGYYKVRMARKGYLYVDMKNITRKILNPFDFVPLYVKVYKDKNGEWKIGKKYI